MMISFIDGGWKTAGRLQRELRRAWRAFFTGAGIVLAAMLAGLAHGATWLVACAFIIGLVGVLLAGLAVEDIQRLGDAMRRLDEERERGGQS